MKILIKEIARREGKKSQTSVANIREIMTIFAEIMADPASKAELRDLFCDYLIKVAKKTSGAKIKRIDFIWHHEEHFDLDKMVENYNKYIQKKYGKKGVSK